MEQAIEQVEPIRDPRKLAAIKKILKEQERPRDCLLFVMGMNATGKESGATALSRNAHTNPDLYDIVAVGDRNHCRWVDFTHYLVRQALSASNMAFQYASADELTLHKTLTRGSLESQISQNTVCLSQGLWVLIDEFSHLSSEPVSSVSIISKPDKTRSRRT